MFRGGRSGDRGGGRTPQGGVGRMGGTRRGAGPGGECVCPSCGHRMVHEVGKPCYQTDCPKCGAKMVRA